MAEQDPPDKTLSAAERITELSSIDKDIASLVQAAGLAVQALAACPPPAPEAQPSPITLDSQKATFAASAATYFRLLDSISARLRRQIYALEEGDIIAPEVAPPRAGLAKKGATLAPPVASTPPAHAGAAKGGHAPISTMGNLDLAWLNSRNDVVGKEKEGELWAKAKDFLQGLETQGTSQAASPTQEAVEAEPELMDIDHRRS
ncbi:MAG: hypothetical protein M1826_002951 [Phylliscum demangeonii]|nr:MAG: hypothetical protein M1826_002951 [Phylliscum demangeonii]